MESWLMWMGGTVAGLAAGALSGMFGIGGGIILVPVLGTLLGLDQHRAQGIALATMLAPIGLPAVLYYRRAGHRIQWPLVGYLLMGFLVGITGGSFLANAIPARPLRWGFVGFLVIMALRYGLSARSQPSQGSMEEPLSRIPVGPCLLIGVMGGLASGLLGIGGGLLIIPLLAFWLKMPQHEAQLTSLALMLPPIGLPGVLVYAGGHGLPWMILLFTGAGFAGGAFLGARFATRLRMKSLQGFFAVLTLVLAVLLAFRA